MQDAYRDLDQLEMHVTTLNPGMEPHPPHRHVNEELIIMREGQCETLSNGTWVKVGPGSVVFNASNSLHGLAQRGNNAGGLSRDQLEPQQEYGSKSIIVVLPMRLDDSTNEGVCSFRSVTCGNLPD